MRRTGHMGMGEEARSQRMKSIGGSDARIIMSGDQEEIERLWMEKRGEIEPKNFSDVLVVQMGVVLEPLVLDWFELQTGLFVSCEQARCVSESVPWATCTLDGKVSDTVDGEPHSILEAKFMLPFRWTLEGACDKYSAQFAWNMFVSGYDLCRFPVITGGAQFAQVELEADPLYQACVLDVCSDFWDCVKTGRVPGHPVIPSPPVEAIRVVDMTGSNEFAQAAADFIETLDSVKRNEKSKKDLKNLMPPDVKEARGYGVKLSRSKTGTVSIKAEKEAIAE